MPGTLRGGDRADCAILDDFHCTVLEGTVMDVIVEVVDLTSVVF